MSRRQHERTSLFRGGIGTYVSRTGDRHRRRFSKSGDLAIEQAYRTHWVSPQLSMAKQEQLAERQDRAPDLVLISPLSDWTCSNCSGTGDFC
jgi:hypothetical protein